MLKITKIGGCILSLALSGLSVSVSAGESVNLNIAIQECAKLTNDQQKLACFDKLAQPAVKASEIDMAINETQPTMINTEKSPVKPEDINGFGQEHIQKTTEQKALEVKSVELMISKLTKLIRGEWKITFKNGQVWQQKDSRRINLYVGDSVVIEKGALSSFYLKKVDSNKRIPVKRLK